MQKATKYNWGYKLFFTGLFSISILAIALLVRGGTTLSLPNPSTPLSFYSNHQRENHKLLIINAINSARSHIDLAIFSLTDRDLIAHLNNQAKRGIRVRIYYDDRHSRSLEKWIDPSITLVKKSGCKLMHHKILIVDRSLILLGSTNFTPSSLLYHDNMLVGLFSHEIGQWLIENLTEKDRHRSFEIEGHTITLHLMPDKSHQAIEHLTYLLEKSEKRIDLSLFALSHPKLIEKLENSRAKVHAVLDSGQGNRKRKEIAHRLSSGYELMHQKCALIDGHTAIVGSANWSKSAFRSNQDFLLIIENLTQEEAKTFEARLGF